MGVTLVGLIDAVVVADVVVGLMVLFVLLLCALSRRVFTLFIIAKLALVRSDLDACVLVFTVSEGDKRFGALAVATEADGTCCCMLDGGRGILAKRISKASSSFLAINTTSDSGALYL